MRKSQISVYILGLALLIGCICPCTQAQTVPPNLKVSLAIASNSRTQGLIYLRDAIANDPIPATITIVNGASEIIANRGFMDTNFRLYLQFTNPEGKTIISDVLQSQNSNDPPPPPHYPEPNGKLIQGEAVERIPASFIRTWEINDANKFYTLLKAGRYSVKVIVSLRTFSEPTVDIPPIGEHAALNQILWSGSLESNSVEFTILEDKDKDGYYFPLAWGLYGKADCDDNDPNVYPGASKIYCYGKNNNCDQAAPDISTPLPVSPANKATGGSLTPTLSWQYGPQSGCVISSRLQVSRDPGFASLSADQEVLGTSYSFRVPLAQGTTYYWRVKSISSSYKEESNWSSVFSFSTSGTLKLGTMHLKAVSYILGLGIHPTVSQNLMSSLFVRVFNKSTDPCVTRYGIISWPNYNEIWNKCTSVISGITNTKGELDLAVSPGTYLIIGQHDPKTSTSGDEIYAADTVINLKANQILNAYLYYFFLANGSSCPAKYAEFTGSSLQVVQPEYIEWTGTKEPYPFVFNSVGNWTVETSITPPDGFVTDYNLLSAQVADSTTSVQFTVTDMGSEWVDSKIKFRIKHKGQWREHHSQVGVRLDRNLAKKKGLTVFGEKVKQP
jgi:hypothetical protein